MIQSIRKNTLRKRRPSKSNEEKHKKSSSGGGHTENFCLVAPNIDSIDPADDLPEECF
jgi:hypothetical protein